MGPARHVCTGDYYAVLPAAFSSAGGSRRSSLSAETHSDDAVELPEELSSLWLDVENSRGARNVKRVTRSRDVALSSSEDKLTVASNWTRSPANDRRRQMRCIRNENECQEVDVLMEKIPECLPDLKSCIERWTTLESLGCWQNLDLRANIIIGALWGGQVSLICESCGLSHDLFSQRAGFALRRLTASQTVRRYCMCDWEPPQEPAVRLGPTAQGSGTEARLRSAADGYRRNLTDFWTKLARTAIWVQMCAL